MLRRQVPDDLADAGAATAAVGLGLAAGIDVGGGDRRGGHLLQGVRHDRLDPVAGDHIAMTHNHREPY